MPPRYPNLREPHYLPTSKSVVDELGLAPGEQLPISKVASVPRLYGDRAVAVDRGEPDITAGRIHPGSERIVTARVTPESPLDIHPYGSVREGIEAGRSNPQLRELHEFAQSELQRMRSSFPEEEWDKPQAVLSRPGSQEELLKKQQELQGRIDTEPGMVRDTPNARYRRALEGIVSGRGLQFAHMVATRPGSPTDLITSTARGLVIPSRNEVTRILNTSRP